MQVDPDRLRKIPSANLCPQLKSVTTPALGYYGREPAELTAVAMGQVPNVVAKDTILDLGVTWRIAGVGSDLSWRMENEERPVWFEWRNWERRDGTDRLEFDVCW